jgi:hypothetical protein
MPPATLHRVEARWEGDDRGRGVADGARLTAGIEELLRLSTAHDWITEAPETHLLPRLRQACEEPGSQFSLDSAETDPGGGLLVNLRWRGDDSQGQIRAGVIALAGRVAETATYIRQREDPLRFEILTGIPSGDGRFATHGHLLEVRVLR